MQYVIGVAMANYPDWVLKYKKKGTYINKVGDKYYLYAAHSERIKGTAKVRRISDGYLGRITESDGLIPPKDKVSTPIVSYEFGLSFAVISCTAHIRTGLNVSFLKYGDLVYVCSVLAFIYGFHDQALFLQSYLHLHFDAVVYPEKFTKAQGSGIERGQRMIADTVAGYFGNDLPLMKAHFSNIRIVGLNNKRYTSSPSPVALTLADKYDIDWSTALWQK